MYNPKKIIQVEIKKILEVAKIMWTSLEDNKYLSFKVKEILNT